MDKRSCKLFGILSLVACATLIFIAVDRHNTNVNNVRAMNAIHQSSPFVGLAGGGELVPATPAATKYAIFFGALAGIGGVVLLMKSAKMEA